MPTARKSKATNRLNLPAGAGRAGEAAAVSILRNHGFEIVRTNYRVREGEIDIVAKLENELVFVEVKTRRSNSFGSPEESVSQRKAERLITAAQSYLAENGAEQSDWRIDLLAIEMDSAGRVVRSNLVENAVTF